MAEIINQINLKEKEKESRLERIEAMKRNTKDRPNLSQLGSTILNRGDVSEINKNQFFLEEQIEKMRTNQQNFRKIV